MRNRKREICTSGSARDEDGQPPHLLGRRLAYVVNRRAVVDQATEEVERLRKALEGEAQHFDLLDERTRTQAKRAGAELKERLGIGEKRTFSISTLRGAHVDNREWLDDPAAPAIIVGTVDMIGSRLLFEGYGVSRNMRPYHAGLLGADTLVVLDEAHLVPPFEALLQSIVGRTPEFGPRLDSDREIVPPLRLLSLSATGRARTPAPDGGAEEVTFRLERGDLSDPVVERRLAAKKAIGFVKIDDEKDELVEALARNAWKLSGEGSKPARCLVYCDKREIAERTKKAIEALADGNRKSGVPKIQVDTELFVGARRVREREIAKSWLHDHGFLAGSDSPAKPTFLIATSAGEVGVDLDADHMVCDLVPWERMVQRLGRVNRRGEGDATIVVVHGDEPKSKKPDAPTDQEKRQAVGFRSLAVLRELPNLGGGRDASPGALRELKLRAVTDEALGEMIGKATTPEPLRPALTRPTVDAWSMTSLENHTGRPEVAPWLRGWVEDDPQTTVIWRAYLPVRQGIADWPRTSVEKKEIEKFFEAPPPHDSEKLETETYRVVEWLRNRANSLLGRDEPASEEQVAGTRNYLLPGGGHPHMMRPRFADSIRASSPSGLREQA
jgi:CRISPR-associated endonuclease/helicase Cas3